MVEVRGFLLSTMALAIMISAVPAAAFHGAAWVATGSMCLAGTDVCVPGRVVWSGAGAGGIGAFRVGTDGANVGATLTGREEYQELHFASVPGCAAAELYAYHGYDLQSGGQALRVTGPWENCLGGGVRAGLQTCHLTGHFLQVFELDLTCRPP